MNNTANASALIQGAHDEGILSGASLSALQIPDIGNAINNAIGTSIEINAAQAVHVVMLLDDSSSISWAWDEDKQQTTDNSQLVIDGHNLVIEALRGSKARDGIFVTTLLLNGKVINSFAHIDNAVLLDSNNYVAEGGTPLYDQCTITIGSAVAKAQEISEDGVPCRSIILVTTDGMDEHSVNTKASDVKSVVGDVLQTEQYIVAAMGIPGARHGYRGKSLDFRKVFEQMGIQDKWILTPGESQKEIRAAFQLFSQSATTASQNAGSFSKTALGGFGN